MRAFVALELPEKLRHALQRMQAGLPGRHVSEENLHLTLAFLGDVDAGRLRDLHGVLSGLKLAAPFLRVTGCDVFEGRKPMLAFAALAPDPYLVAARRAVRQAARDAGIELRRERFRPHVTLSRFGRGIGARDEARLATCLGPVARIVEERAERFGLYRSQLRADGPIHELLACYAFA
ncbi:MAG: 2'-5' RNA ligase [Rhodobacteraceae bacterium HLUCCO07]|nr:MAG: 2'-5' RNA ligase [Rhodobacteraceae bacterium HLUCCO07]